MKLLHESDVCFYQSFGDTQYFPNECVFTLIPVLMRCSVISRDASVTEQKNDGDSVQPICRFSGITMSTLSIVSIVD